MRMTTVSLMVVTCGFAGAAYAGIGVTDLGTGAPPAIVPLGSGAGSPITKQPPDGRPVFGDVTDVTIAPGCFVDFSIPMSHRTIGAGWATWSHGYTGDVYYTNGATSVTMTMDSPEGVDWFHFYAEPNPFGVFSMTATGVDDTGGTVSLTKGVEGSAGASGWGFYGTDGMCVESVRLVSDVDFAVGEFGMHKKPAPGALMTLGLGALVMTRRRR